MSHDTSHLALQGLRIFISYPRGGAAHGHAESVHGDLEKRGALVWRDERSIAEGDDDWYARIRDGLERADAVACVVGAESEGCRWQQREMLLADKLALPVVALRTAPVTLPFYMIEKQPVELNAVHAVASLETLAQALHQAVSSRVRPAHGTISAAPDAGQRQRERAYLENLLYSELSDREARYEPLAGRERAESSLARSHKGLRMDTSFLLKAFKQEDAAAPEPAPQDCNDVLDVYRELPTRRIRRLAVLGEPGAGKSFSLERIACDYARRALHDPAAPLPLLVRLGLWTREGDGLLAFIERQLGALGRDVITLRDQHRAVLLLDGLNEIPPGQRQLKANQIRELAEDERYAGVVVSCRERDFTADYRLPFDTLTLTPLSPPQIHRFLHRAYGHHAGPQQGQAEAEAHFWQLAGGEALREVWQVWEAAGASFTQFWTADDIPRENPNVYDSTNGEHVALWRAARHDTRNLLRLAANPYLLFVMIEMKVQGVVPRSRADLFDGFLAILHERERKARMARHDARSVPDFGQWLAALTELAGAMQRLQVGDAADKSAGAVTALGRGAWPSSLTMDSLNFSIDASALQCVGDDLRFTHQLLQEALASRLLLTASASDAHKASEFWPADRWWQRSGWEVVAQIAAEASAADDTALWRLIRWLAQAQPEVACEAWRAAGAPAMPQALATDIAREWLPKLTDAQQEPSPLARAAIGRALAGFDLDQRRGIGLRANGLPDIDWVVIPGDQPFVYQKGEKGSAKKIKLPSFEIARYPVTNRQYQAFIDAGGYADDRWWKGLARRIETPRGPAWKDANAPRETVSWYEAVAFCRWLGDTLHGNEDAIQLPTEQQWERAARGTDGREYPWGGGYRAGCANCDEPGSDIEGGTYVGRTTAVGIFPYPSSEGAHDLAGNVSEWCLNEYERPARAGIGGYEPRVLRGGSWLNDAPSLRAAYRSLGEAFDSFLNIGFRVCRGSHIEPQGAGALDAEWPDR